jgi:flavin reductase (DIM6/NTAB) family NADH-FMN oxidoreductase RutF
MVPSGNHDLDPEVLTEALGLLIGPVVIVGVAVGDERGGLTASWVTRVSHDPPLLLVSIAHERYTYGLLRRSDHFSVSVLREDGVELGRHFGLQSQRDVDKWSAVDHVLLAGHTPALVRCGARFLCRIKYRFPTGDHDCFVGQIQKAEVVEGGPPLPLRAEDYRS